VAEKPRDAVVKFDTYRNVQLYSGIARFPATAGFLYVLLMRNKWLLVTTVAIRPAHMHVGCVTRGNFYKLLNQRFNNNNNNNNRLV